MSPSNSPDSPQLKEMQSIPKWTRRYAQNRTLGVLIFMVVFVTLAGALGGFSTLAGMAYRSGNTPLLAAAGTCLGVSVVFLFWFSNPWWGGKWLERTAQRFYEPEGEVSLPSGLTEKDQAWGVLAGTLFGASILISVMLGMAGYIPELMIQPVSALYTVPFLLFLSTRLRPVAG